MGFFLFPSNVTIKKVSEETLINVVLDFVNIHPRSKDNLLQWENQAKFLQ